MKQNTSNKRQKLKMKVFHNAKECLRYLKEKSQFGEEVLLDERATAYHPRQTRTFAKEFS
jgi:hypothetical protein